MTVFSFFCFSTKCRAVCFTLLKLAPGSKSKYRRALLQNTTSSPGIGRALSNSKAFHSEMAALWEAVQYIQMVTARGKHLGLNCSAPQQTNTPNGALVTVCFTGPLPFTGSSLRGEETFTPWSSGVCDFVQCCSPAL